MSIFNDEANKDRILAALATLPNAIHEQVRSWVQQAWLGATVLELLAKDHAIITDIDADGIPMLALTATGHRAAAQHKAPERPDQH